MVDLFHAHWSEKTTDKTPELSPRIDKKEKQILKLKKYKPGSFCPYHYTHNLQLLQDKVDLLLCGQRGQHSVVAPTGQLSVVIRVLGRDELQT